MDIHIYGAGKNGQKILEKINKYKNINIRFFFDKNKTGNMEGVAVRKTDDPGIDKTIPVVISIRDLNNAKEAALELMEQGFKKIYWFSDKDSFYREENFLEEQCIACNRWRGSVVSQIEMHVVDFCNLNCRGCSHFSPVFSKEYPDLNSRLKDLDKIKNKFDHIIRFFLLGGEPFLNPELDQYVLKVAELLPDTELLIVTNALLIPRVDEKILKAVKQSGARISISEYEPTKKVMNQIEQRLKEYEIIYHIRDASFKQKFNLPLTIDPNSKRERCCISNGCVTIWNGKIARCPTLMYIGKFNERFQTHLPSEGIYDIDECLAGYELLDELKKPVPLCRYCVKNEINWSICGGDPQLEDFAALD